MKGPRGWLGRGPDAAAVPASDAGDPVAGQAGRTLRLSLVSHTNAGKTTLARTLLGRDVGEVLDQAHVTDEATEYTLLETDAGDRVVLWDTPGFGDSARLLRRLEQQDSPLGWLASQVWDRFADRPLWCSQQAVKNVREDADVVLYLVSAAEEPELAGYVDLEMKILGWMDRPVVVMLNQTGPPAEAGTRRAEEERWREHLAGHAVVRDVVSLDAFARAWPQEGILLERIRDVLPEAQRPFMQRLVTRWEERNLDVFRTAMERLARLLAEAAGDREPLGDGFSRFERKRATDALARRLESATRQATEDLVTIHGLEGRAASEVRGELEDVSAPGERPEPWRAGVVGGLAGGALGGLTADIASGGMTFGGGAVAGALLGAMGLGGLAWGYEQIGGRENPQVTWAPAFLDRALRDALLRYLSVAHAGRGAGEWRERAHPAFWREAIERSLATRQGQQHDAWRLAQRDGPENRARAQERLASLLEGTARDVLAGFYPAAARLLRG